MKTLSLLKIEHRVGTAHQQNLIELISHILRDQYNYEELEEQLSKSKRTVQRMIEEINSYFPCISNKINMIDGKAYLAFRKNISDLEIEKLFQNKNQVPLVYVFLKSLVKPIKIAEISASLNITNKKTIKIFDKIINTTELGDFADYDWEADDVDFFLDLKPIANCISE